MEATWIGFQLWCAAVEAAGTTEIDKVRAAADGVSFDAPQGKVTIDGATQHIFQKAMIGKATADGQFQVIWDSGEQPLKPDPYLKGYSWGPSVTSGA